MILTILESVPISARTQSGQSKSPQNRNLYNEDRSAIKWDIGITSWWMLKEINCGFSKFFGETDIEEERRILVSVKSKNEMRWWESRGKLGWELFVFIMLSLLAETLSITYQLIGWINQFQKETMTTERINKNKQFGSITIFIFCYTPCNQNQVYPFNPFVVVWVYMIGHKYDEINYISSI